LQWKGLEECDVVAAEGAGKEGGQEDNVVSCGMDFGVELDDGKRGFEGGP
jgi:hypothetical protein